MGDRRDEATWVALELTRAGELKVEDGSLEADLRSALGVDQEWPIFIPAKVYSKSGKRVTVHLVEGYAFVASGLDEVSYFRLEQEKKIVSKVMTAKSPSGLRVLSTISDQQIFALKKQLLEKIAADISPGMTAEVTDGKYKGLEGEVVSIENDYALVFIRLRSLHVIAQIPRVFLDARVVDGEEEE